jgi:hypothetical protein
MEGLMGLNLVIGWPQGIYLALVFLGMIHAINQHGKDREDKYDAKVGFVSTSIILVLLWWGGFFG